MLVNEFHNSASVVIDAAPADVFAAITDLDRLPEWNAHLPRVVQHPGRPLAEGVEWVVRINALGTHWHSRARVLTYDPQALRFEHQSCSDDGNPSYARWHWSVSPTTDDRAKLDVAWEVYPRTFWRRALFSKFRRSQLPNEVRTSLDTLATKLTRTQPMISS